ncbi:DnaJ domain [Dehalogenimonas alkenigignens]|uniref:DnaJ domain n=1 Tax=Dehalogenimonas alkenigignens TaxID=1217799 RepID=A0A0W0GKF4_9CHLR|nr:J domain-containing protein [Dehalogenimonas alkenigignens]KTB49036.1 DnaJ domain [Dehalogenimonas alkenigignens]
MKPTAAPSFEEITKARLLLNLGEAATLKEIKSAYRRLSHRLHPDKQGEAPAMARLNKAYETLMSYVEDYAYGFTEAEFFRRYPRAEHLDRFFEGGF